MTEPRLPQLADSDIQGSYPALLRAAQRARELARATGVPLVYWQDGRVVYEYVSKDTAEGSPAAPSSPSPTSES
ncbi:MAG: hypothetical protein K8T25_11050 [Planctomycetia bacterium]|nr:hypothetical protein [Planctomycetia bacterium]